MTLTEIDDQIVTAGEGVVLRRKADNGNTITLTFSNRESFGDYYDNALSGFDKAKAKADLPASGTNYVLAQSGSDNTKVAFRPYTGATFPAHKAYLNVPSGSGARELSISIDGEVTAIDNVEIINADGSREYYDLSGRRLTTPKKGINIVNGHKVIIK